MASQLGEPDLDGIVDTFELRRVYDEPADSIAYGDQTTAHGGSGNAAIQQLVLLPQTAA